MPYLDTILLAAGDYNPQISLVLKDSSTGDPANAKTWEPIDLSSSSRTVALVISKLGETEVLAEIPCTKVSGGSEGEVFAPIGSYQFEETGVYVGDIKMYEDDKPVTVYERIRFRVR